ncbi:endoglucanase X [Hyphodiscus hymeniophilus]|uniref:Endoglucanase X n=1 Tax=Hyphodiscus hymeniophilus TaxID=353542 RepID=A0A9P6SLJ6_9HELO|nr:endoglucanase X [Hyphodiscus hymeniophilus]
MYSICKPSDHASIIILLSLLVVSIQAHFLDPLFPRDISSSPFLSSRSIANTNDVPLRILCLGASITYGFHSTDGNGFRYALRGKLIADGNDVNMLGVVSHGNMSNNLVDGFPGLRIDQVAAKTQLALEDKPNIVLIELGTNDCLQNHDVQNAHTRLGELVGRVLNASPNVTVIVGTLLPNAAAKGEANILTFNSNLPSMVANFTAQGYKVSTVDFHSDWWSLDDIGPDGTHPTDLGYTKMSRVWYNGILEAAKAGNITAPTTVEGVDDYAAGNDTAVAHTAMDVVCQHVNGSVSAQVQACSGSSKTSVLNVCLSIMSAIMRTHADILSDSLHSYFSW